MTTTENQSVDQEHAVSYKSVNPNSGATTRTFATMTDEQLDITLANAHRCFGTWKTATFAQRATVVAKAATLLRERADEFAALATTEMGKRISEARGEVAYSADILDYYSAASVVKRRNRQ